MNDNNFIGIKKSQHESAARGTTWHIPRVKIAKAPFRTLKSGIRVSEGKGRFIWLKVRLIDLPR